jgi:hypothetical protein
MRQNVIGNVTAKPKSGYYHVLFALSRWGAAVLRPYVTDSVEYANEKPQVQKPDVSYGVAATNCVTVWAYASG